MLNSTDVSLRKNNFKPRQYTYVPVHIYTHVFLAFLLGYMVLDAPCTQCVEGKHQNLNFPFLLLAKDTLCAEHN